MGDITLKITGIEELATFLNETAPNAITEGFRDALDNLRNDINTTTTSLCPVDTGALRASIDINVNEFTLTAIAGEDYASYVDGGTRFMDAEPFFEDPITNLTDQFQQDIEQQLERSLQNR